VVAAFFEIMDGPDFMELDGGWACSRGYLYSTYVQNRSC
jgi:hypothetical protein